MKNVSVKNHPAIATQEFFRSTPEEISQLRKEQHELLERLETYWRTVTYLAASELYLKDNFLLREPLEKDHIKDRLLGHWGTTPGINLIYTHLNRLIRNYDLDLFLITGPGHGAPANLANLFLEGSLLEYYPDYTLDYKGVGELLKGFSWPGKFPSHLFPGTPGAIHEGGELGYALATAFGAVMDNPDLIVACIVGDGEAESGPTATAWHSTKFLDPEESGAVLPILHLNGYKIANPTIYGTMDDDELYSLFRGYGYQPRIIEDSDLHADMFLALDWAYNEIRKIQKDARSGKKQLKTRWPMLILRSLKGWSGIKEIDGLPIEGSFRAHQIPANDLKTNPNSFKLVEQWLRSYKPEELFDKNGKPRDDVLANCPKGKRRMGCNPHTFGGDMYKPLSLPDIKDFAVSPTSKTSTELTMRGTNVARSLFEFTKYVIEVIKRNPDNFRIFSPDELVSNKLGEVFEVTHRDYQWPIKPFDSDISNSGGRVLEMLSEHTLQGWLQGYLMTGRHGIFPSYEAFLGIVGTMMDQFAKFLKFSEELSWRKPFASLNYIETSTLWRQEHNGFSHQNPSFINLLLNLKANIARVYLPPDANCLISTMDHCFKSKGHVNLVVANKQEMPQWLTMDEAVNHCRTGGSVWEWASTDSGVNPDVVLVGIGCDPHLEVMAAAHILRKELPQLRVRVVNVTDLMILEKESLHPHGLDNEMFDALFTSDRPVIINFHGYPTAVKHLLFGRDNTNRFHINGYLEEGTTTTPFDMAVRNKTSRFHVIMEAIRLAAPFNPSVAAKANEWVSHYEYTLQEFRTYIDENGKDPDEISEWMWN
ncbi:MAG: Xylulose-5-phosphate phosphoketolase [Chlamydiae bacterium]|nr:Xylulose-5-phosphate phosphoketolase [Chlamydiota bacterium]